jgi:hypothetical protein
MATFLHLILTRFNLPMIEADLDEGWLRYRLDLFRRFTLPSVETQTATSFRWLVLVDPASPPWLLDELASSLDDERYEVVPMTRLGEVGPLALRQIDAHADPGTTHLLTTRLDNDDALAVDFVAAIQRGFSEQSFEFLNFPSGAQLANGRVRLVPHRANPFITLVERLVPGAVPRGAYLCSHMEIAAHGPVRQLRTHPMWLQVIHDRNLDTRAGGFRVLPADVLGRFDISHPAVAEERHYRAGQVRDACDLALRIVRRPWTARRAVELASAIRTLETP